MKSLVTFGANFSPRAYKGTLPAGPVLLVGHEFHARPDGQLEHSIDGDLRAIVPPEGLADYVKHWPDCEPVARELMAAEKSAAATVAPVKKSAGKKSAKAGKGARRA